MGCPLALRLIDEVRLVQGGLLVGRAGMGGLVLSHDGWGVILSASVAGLGLACVYPITISLLSREFGAGAARRVGDVYAVEYWGRAAAVGSGVIVESFR